MARSPSRFNPYWGCAAHFSGGSWRPSGRSHDRGPIRFLIIQPDRRIIRLERGGIPGLLVAIDHRLPQAYHQRAPCRTLYAFGIMPGPGTDAAVRLWVGQGWVSG